MKPFIFLLLIILVSVSSYSQRVWEKDGKYPFTGTISRSTVWETITRTLYSTISFQIVEFSPDLSMHLNVKVDMKRQNNSKRCFDDKSKMEITSGATCITINFLGSADEGDVLTNYGNLLSEDIEFLRHNLIDMVRIYYDEGYDDYKIRDPGSIIPGSRYNRSKDFKTDYFVSTLRSFE